MADSLTLEDVKNAVSKAMHPAINCSLSDLGIVKDVSFENNKAIITLAFPFPNLPIKDMLVNLVKSPVEALGAEADVEITRMTQEEVQKFLSMEQANWKM